ncbi:MAG: penicillin-binding Tp47 domain C-containing protein [Collinsella sp.]
MVAAVKAGTNGLKTVTNNNGTFSFSAAATGTDSGIEGQELKTATGIEPTVKDASGSYGEFLRVDLNGNYGDLGANMQSVTWTLLRRRRDLHQRPCHLRHQVRGRQLDAQVHGHSAGPH